MIQSILILINVSILVILSLIHFYWAFGGKSGVEGTIPERFKESFFNPENSVKNTIATLVVAFGLLVLAFIVSSNYLDLEYIIEASWTTIGTRAIGIVFLLRAIGDFNILGLFKKPSTSLFARNDTRLYVPLCFFIGVSCILITFLK